MDRSQREDDRATGRGLADVIERRQGEIVQRWLGRVTEDLKGRAVHPSDLRDGIDDYLTALVEKLRSRGPVEDRGSDAWATIAREHALTRVRLGFDVSQLLREFVLLRRVVMEAAREEGVMNDAQTDRLVELIEGAVTEAVKSYVQSRDYQARRTEAEHIGFLTHELRNPLSTAMLAAARLARQGALTPEQRRTMDLMNRGHERLERMIDSVLTAERLHAGEIESHPTEVHLAEVVEQALTSARAAAAKKNLAFHVYVQPETLVFADPSLTQSVVQNLVDNAVKYTDQGSVELSMEELPSDVMIHVRDTCHGISEAELQTIFEPFRRGHTGKPGSGLGLAIARQAVEAQGGTIGAESKGHSGCHFWFTLPRVRH